MSEIKEHDLRTRIALYCAWTVVFLAVIAAYWPGLSGPWLFDDFGSIANLGDYGGVRNWETFKAFVFGGTAGPTGRPLSLLSFLVDGQNWPTDAWPFKRTNLVIHILNGALLGLLISQVLSVLRFERARAQKVALVAAACWMLHPFLVSTTLYIVQRMAQLSTLFIFAGLIGYIIGRKQVHARPGLAYAAMSASLVGFTFLAMISKENGILLPLFALVLELTIFAASDRQQLNRYWLATFVVAPSIVIFLYLADRVVDARFFDIVPTREFSIYERLLTQSRVVVDYLQNWFIPKLYTTGIFQDHFIKSTSLFTPLSTLIAAVFHFAIIGLAIVQRRRWPLLSFAILFFYVGHLLESTVINLELYFEHRNYLSAAMLFVPLVAYLQQKLNVRTFFVVCSLSVALLGGFTRYSSTIWQDYELMVATSAHKAPTSARAQAYYAANLFNAGHVDAAFDVLDRAVENIGSTKPLLLVQRLILMCHTHRLDEEDFEHTAGILATTVYDPRMINMYQVLSEGIVGQACPAIPVAALESMFEGMLKSPPNDDPTSSRYSQLNYLLGYARAFNGKPEAAYAAFEASVESRPGASSAMAMAAVLAENRHYDEALRLSDVAMRLLDRGGTGVLGGARVSEADIRTFQEVVRADKAAVQAGDTPGPAE